MKSLSKLALVMMMVSFLYACGTTGEVEETTAEQPATESMDNSGASSSPFPGGSSSSNELSQAEMGGASGSGLDDPNSLLAKRVVYFEFDRSDVKSEYQAVVQAHGEYLAANSGASMTIEGHGDERGSREYNIALGERRAQSVQRMLLAVGARASQLSVVSYGEERPASVGHDESAWSLNRRAELIYTSR